MDAFKSGDGILTVGLGTLGERGCLEHLDDRLRR